MEEENEEERIQKAVLKAEFEYDLAREEAQLEYLKEKDIIKKQKESINKLINYIAIKENSDYQEIVEKFEIYVED